MNIEVYADGSGNTFDSDGGWGWRIVIDGKLHSEGSGYLKAATNNTAELTAAIEGLTAAQAHITTNTIKADITLVSDSQLTLGYANGKYKCKAVHLGPLYIKIRTLYDTLNADVRWVKGHSGDEHNDAVDLLAGNARKNKQP